MKGFRKGAICRNELTVIFESRLRRAGKDPATIESALLNFKSGLILGAILILRRFLLSVLLIIM